MKKLSSQRIGRAHFNGWVCVSIFVTLLLLLSSHAVFSGGMFSGTLVAKLDYSIPVLTLMIAYIMFFFGSLIGISALLLRLIIRRSHDLNLTGMWASLFCVSILISFFDLLQIIDVRNWVIFVTQIFSSAFVAILIIVPGDLGNNNFGEISHSRFLDFIYQRS